MDGRFIIAVVDDDLRVLESFNEFLQSNSYIVRLFASAEAFLESDSLYEVDCLVSDIGLPGMNGWDLRQVVETNRHGLPVLLITGRYDEQAHASFRPHSSGLFFCKPFKVEQLLAVLRNVLPSN
jgi:FixJ family two-component response regulator